MTAAVFNGTLAPITPHSVLSKLPAIFSPYIKKKQEDAHEFMRGFLDVLHAEDRNLWKVQMSWVQQIFGGWLRSQVTCSTCKYQSIKLETFLDLNLEIQDIGKLTDALIKFTGIEYLTESNQYRCNIHVDATKQLTIEEAPPILVLSLKRFNSGARKAQSVLEYPSCLSLDKFVSPGHPATSYELYGQILHYGPHTTSGHYIAHVKGGLGQWWQMDDEIVRPLPFSPVNDQNAYILFYARVPQQITAQESSHTVPDPLATPEETADSLSCMLTSKGRAKNGRQPIKNAPPRKRTQIDIGCGRTLLYDGAEAGLQWRIKTVKPSTMEYTPKPRSHAIDGIRNPFLGHHASPVQLPRVIVSNGIPYKNPTLSAENGPSRSSAKNMTVSPIDTFNPSSKHQRRFIIGPNGPYTLERMKNTLRESKPRAQR